MKIQRAVTGRPMWQVSLKASIQRGQKRLRAMLCAIALKQCAPCQAQVFGRAA